MRRLFTTVITIAAAGRQRFLHVAAVGAVRAVWIGFGIVGGESAIADFREDIRFAEEQQVAREPVLDRLEVLPVIVGGELDEAGVRRLDERPQVLDLACGTGDLCRELAKQGQRAVGFDFSFGMLALYPVLLRADDLGRVDTRPDDQPR